MTDVNWIDQHGYCDGPHAEKHNGTWRYPKGRTGIRQFIKTSGSVNYELVCLTEGCRHNTSPIPNHAAQPLLDKLPVLPTRRSSLTGTTYCCYQGCESTQIEWHHFAPRNTFGRTADNYPIMPLCREHHREWHRTMDGYQWKAAAIR